MTDAIPRHLPTTPQVQQLLHTIRMALWTWDLNTGETYWDKKFWAWLGREADLPTVDTFFSWVQPDDLLVLRTLLQKHLKDGDEYQIAVRLMHADGHYRWFETSGYAQRDETGKPVLMTGILRDVHQQYVTAEALNNSTSLLEETGQMAQVGGWRVELFPQQRIQWTSEVHRIHGLPLDYPLDVAKGINFYVPEHQDIIASAFGRAITHQEEYNLQLQILTANGNRRWVQTSGHPVVKNGQVVAVQGVFQDIDQQKKQTLKVEESLGIISEQNKRLHTFAHVVSHNLSSHAATLKSLLELRKLADDPLDTAFFDESLEKISDALSNTIGELNDMVRVQEQPSLTRRTLRFEEVYNDAVTALGSQLRKSEALLNAHFGACPTIDYNPAYLDSILLNLLSNALKYHKPGLPAKVSVRSFLSSGKPALEVKDEGLGMDLAKMGDRLFGMYQTFHGNEDAKGIGLYLVHSQVEAMGGRIDVVSRPGKGSTFTVYF